MTAAALEPAQLLLVGDRVDAAALCRGLEEVQLAARCEQAAGVAEASARLEAAPIDCVVVDHGELAAAIAIARALREAAPTVPLLLIAPGDPASEEAAFASEATDVIAREDLTPVRLARRLRFLIRIARAEAQAEAQVARSQASAAARDEVLAVVAHDLRSPLNAISLACEALSDDVTAEQRVRYVAAIRRAAVRAERLLKDLLDVSQIEAGALRVDPRPVPVASILNQARSDHESIARDAGVELGVAIDGDVGAVVCDKDRTLQVLANLIVNACKYAPKAPVTLAARIDGEWTELSVRDGGPGIAADVLPHVFDRFWQARKHNRAGAGLGLAIARGIVDALGGTIRVENAAGGGARFVVRLPTAR